MTASATRGFGLHCTAEHPFPGLRPFGFGDRGYFFGREDQIFALYRLLDLSHFVAVIGSSGSGKSSLVRAGLSPLLHEETESIGDRHWRTVVMTPGGAPLQRLGDALMSLVPEADSPESRTDREIRRDRIGLALRRSSFGLAAALDEIPGARDTSLLIVVDQFEELFRYASPGGTNTADRVAEALWRDEAANFVQQLLEITSGREREVHVLITMRSDFIGDCARFHGLPEAVSTAQFLTPSLTRDQWDDVIRQPVEKAGASIEPALVERLQIDVGNELDQLPVLQHCLARLWAKAGEDVVPPNQRRLTLRHYGEVGGVADALSQHANEVMRDLPGLELAVEQVFRALSEVDRERRARRRALPFAQLRDETGIAEPDLRKVLDRFRDEDCLFIVPPLIAVPVLRDETRVDVVHEALLRRWNMISGHTPSDGAAEGGWLAAEDSDGRFYRALLALLDTGSRSGAFTIPEDQIESRWEWWKSRPRTDAWAERYGGRRDEIERLFADSRAAAETARGSRERELATRNEARRNRAILLAVLPVLLIAIVAAVVAVLSGNSAANAAKAESLQTQKAVQERQRAVDATKSAVAAQNSLALALGKVKASKIAADRAADNARKYARKEALSNARATREATIAKAATLRAEREAALATIAGRRAEHESKVARAAQDRVIALQAEQLATTKSKAAVEQRLTRNEMTAAQQRALNSQEAEVYNAGVIDEDRGNYSEAIDEFSRAIKLRPSDEMAWTARGWTYSKLAKPDLAVADLKRALQLNPNNALALYRLGSIAVADRRWDEAIGYLDLRLKLMPKDLSGLTMRGTAYAGKGRFDSAIADFDAALAISPRNASAFIDRGDAYERMGNHVHAAADFNEAIKLDPTSYIAFRELGVTQFDEGRLTEALANLRRASTMRPTDAYSVLWIQMIRWKTGAPNGSLEADAEYLNHNAWPYPVVDLALGKRTLDDVLAASKQKDLPNRGHECEALFYVGEYLIAKHDPRGADYVKSAADICPYSYVEFAGARSELTRLGS